MSKQANWVIRIARQGGFTAHFNLNRIFYTKEAIRKAVLEIAPRFKNSDGNNYDSIF